MCSVSFVFISSSVTISRYVCDDIQRDLDHRAWQLI